MIIRIETPADTTATIDAWRSSNDRLRGVKKMPSDMT